MGARSDGRLVFSVGASRSGKTQYVMSQIKKASRLLVWDVEGEYAARFGLTIIEGKAALHNFIKRYPKGAAKIAYHPRNLNEFDWFCRMAYIWSISWPATIVCEEIANATNAVKARGYWGILVSRGLKYGPHVYAVAQRAQEIDKSLLGNASTVNVCRPNTQRDAYYICDVFGLNPWDIPDADLEMLQRHKDRTLVKSRLTFQNGKPVSRKIARFSRHF